MIEVTNADLEAQLEEVEVLQAIFGEGGFQVLNRPLATALGVYQISVHPEVPQNASQEAYLAFVGTVHAPQVRTKVAICITQGEV